MNSSLSLHPKTILAGLYYTVVLGGILALIWSMPRIYHLVAMTVLALFISYLLNPAVQFLERYELTRTTATTVVFLFLVGVFTWGMVRLAPLVWDQFLELREFLATHEPTKLIQGYLTELENRLGFIPQGSLSGQVGTVYQWTIDQLTGIPQILYVTFQYLLIVPFIAFFLTRDRRRMRRVVVQSVPNQFFEMMFNLYYKVDKKLGAYIRGIVIESCIIGALTVAGLWLVDVRYFVVIGFFAGVANVVPYFGPFAGAVPAIVVEAVRIEDPVKILPVVAVFVLVQLLDNVVLKPVIVAKTMNLHPLLVLLVVVAGGQLYGIMGMIVSIPLASMFIVIVSEFSWALNNYSFSP